MWHPDPDQLALAALPAEDAGRRVGEHLVSCPLCRGQVESLHRTVELAREHGDATDDGAGPPERVWQAISNELAIGGAVPMVPPSPMGRPSSTLPVRGSARPERRRFALAALAAAVGLVVGLAGGVVVASARSAPDPSGPVVARLVPVGPLDPGSSGRVAMVRAGDGGRMEVTLAGVTDLAGGDYLQVWLLDPADAELVALGGLTRDGAVYRGVFTVPAGLPFAVFDTVDVSAERWDGDPGHSQRSILRGELLG